jgi:hypothetical protein
VRVSESSTIASAAISKISVERGEDVDRRGRARARTGAKKQQTYGYDAKFDNPDNGGEDAAYRRSYINHDPSTGLTRDG